MNLENITLADFTDLLDKIADKNLTPEERILAFTQSVRLVLMADYARVQAEKISEVTTKPKLVLP